MDNKYKEYNKIIEHMQGRYGKNTQYYNVILADVNNSIKKSIERIGDTIREASTETVSENRQVYFNTFIDLCNVYYKLI